LNRYLKYVCRTSTVFFASKCSSLPTAATNDSYGSENENG